MKKLLIILYLIPLFAKSQLNGALILSGRVVGENHEGITSASITFKVPNTRGFNVPNNFRFLQLVDGVDMQAATLGVPLGNAIGPTELDIETIEITPGAASALYGMNAINGLANLQTKSPFKY